MKQAFFLPVVLISMVQLLVGCVAPTAEKSGATLPSPAVPAPRIVNLYNFIRNEDYRLANSQDVLFEATRQQVALSRKYNLPTTWALQYDALINPRYQKLLKEQAGPGDEIAAWWELPRGLVEKAGIKWRGEHDWDSTANVGFAPGYTPEERRKLVDVYMADFKAIYGAYPRSVGSWFIDEVTLQYMNERYGVIASCNCKDQIGTDGYTLSGGYWNQAYYPSKVNAYMPAQTRAGQIDVPIFRMLGSDPIYQYGHADRIYSLEPVYAWAGGSAAWVDWFLNALTRQPCLAFAYTQAGQENSFGWDAMKAGYLLQIERLDRLSKSGEIKLQTLAQSGGWFRKNFAVTPPTSFVTIDDWKNEGRRSVWYDSRFYRLNLFWDRDGLQIRDLHRFDESVKSVTHDEPLKTHTLAYGTLPIVDGTADSAQERVGAFPVLIAADGTASRMEIDGAPIVNQLNATDLQITQSLKGGGTLTITARESSVITAAVDSAGKPLRWAFDWRLSGAQKSAVQSVTGSKVRFHTSEADFHLELESKRGEYQRVGNNVIRLVPNAEGKLVLLLAGS